MNADHIVTRMSELVLSSRRLEVLDEELIDEIARSHVANLDLSGNLLSALPPSVATFQLLRHLNLSSNQIRELAPELCLLTELETLEVKHNLMKGLPSKFGDLKNLKMLNLSSNQFDQFPSQICELEDLRELRLGANFITHIPSSIGKLKRYGCMQ